LTQTTQHTHQSGRAGIVIKGKGNIVVIDPMHDQRCYKKTLQPGPAATNSPAHALFETEDSTLYGL